jgi:hypothetical protein
MFSLTPLLGGFQEVDTYTDVGFEPVRIVSADSRRAILYIVNPATEQLNIWHNPVVPLPGQPFWNIPPLSTLRFSWPFDGPLSTWSWLGSFPNTTATVYCLQVLWLPEQLAGTSG